MKFLDALFGKKKEASVEDGNPALVRAMHEIALHDNPENRKKLYEAFLGSMLWVPVPEIPAGLGPGMQATKTGMQIQLTGNLDRNQVRITTAFTDVEALRNWDPNTPYLRLKAQELFRFVMGTDIQAVVINPFDPIRKMIRPGGRVNRSELDLLSQGIVPSPIGPKNVQFQMKAGEQVFIGRPTNPPSPAIEELLRNKAASLPAIAELYVFQMATKAGSSHTVIGIDVSGDVPRNQQDEIAHGLGTCVRSELKANQSLDFMFLNGSLRDQVRSGCALIFRRP
jgi:hypothetical protein